MSTDQQPTSYDPRYDGIYQRGGSASVQAGYDVDSRRDDVQEATREVTPEAPEPAREVHQRTTTPAFAYEQRRVEAPVVEPGAESAIREVGAQPELPVGARPSRNPYDIWVWVVAAVLTGLGVYFVAAPVMFEQEFAVQFNSGQFAMSPWSLPWFENTKVLAPPLILLGVGTAVVQLFILSIRHTLRTR